ncbi:MAG: NAD(P)-binding domain-containing protein [Spirochaetes bacterium]|nr:NAD(P)-binding domain-containing protein [Spirochaetota bacterium]
MKTVGFIGLGVMGHFMAGHLAQKLPEGSGKEFFAYDIDSAKARAFADAAGAAASAGVKISLATGLSGMAGCDIVFLSLPSSEAVREVILGKEGLALSLKKGSVVVDTSTTEMGVVKAAAAGLEAAGIGFIDSPVSGGELAAKNGTLSFMAGGRQDVFDAVKPYCQTMAASVVYMGATGSGQAAKAVNQMIVGAAFAVIAESFSMGVKSGLDPKALYEAIKGGWAGSKVLDVAAADMFSREFKPGGTVDIHWKDLGYALSLSKDTDSPVPVTALVHEVFKAARARGEGQKSQPAVVRLWEDLLKIEVK